MYQDSIGFANGFENWTDFLNNVTMSGQTMGGTTTAQVSMPSAQAPVFGNENTGLSEFPGTEWLNQVDLYNGMATYNEEEWYQ